MEENPATSPAKPVRKRRWFQYSMRTLLMLTAVCAALFAWWSYKARQRKQAADALPKRAVVTWSPSRWSSYFPAHFLESIDISFYATVTVVDFSSNCSEQITDEEIEQTIRLQTIRAILVCETHITGDQYARLQKALPNCTIYDPVITLGATPTAKSIEAQLETLQEAAVQRAVVEGWIDSGANGPHPLVP